MKVLLREGRKGQFVRYPSEWPYRMTHTGKRRFDTRCDFIVGMCACGDRHTGTEDWVCASLDEHDMRIETHSEWQKRMGGRED